MENVKGLAENKILTITLSGHIDSVNALIILKMRIQILLL